MYKFENIRALGLAVEAARPHPKSRCSSGGINPDFYGSLTFKEAVAAAVFTNTELLKSDSAEYSS